MTIPQPPRQIQLVHPRPVLGAIGWVLVYLVFALTALIPFALAHELFFVLVSQQVTAEVTSLHERPNSSGTYDRVAHYKYALPGRAPRADQSLVTWSEFRRMSEPFIFSGHRPDDMIFNAELRASLPVRAYELGPIAHSRAVGHPWSGLFLLIPSLLSGIFVLLSIALYRAAFIVRPRRRRLYTDGAAVSGQIIGWTERRTNRGFSYVVHYDFTPAGSAQPIRGSSALIGIGIKQVAVGQAVTVLHDPDNPNRNIAYEFGGYRWV